MSIPKTQSQIFEQVITPDNLAFKKLGITIGAIPKKLSGIPDIPEKTVSFLPLKAEKIPQLLQQEADDAPLAKVEIDYTPHTAAVEEKLDILHHHRTPTSAEHPPRFVKPHAPYDVFSAKIYNTRELTKPGAPKRTFHFDLDVSEYPAESGVDFKVGGAIGVQAPNEESMVEEVMDLLLIPKTARDKRVILKTAGGRWPTIWGEEKPRELITTRRDLLTWCADIQSYPPTKGLLRLMAEYASDPNEKKVLLFLTSAEGQGTFCELRAGQMHITLAHLLNAFPSSKPPLDELLSELKQLMPRFYSLSNDPHENCIPVEGCHRLIEIAVTVHETPDWRGGMRTGLGSGFFERQARKFIEAEKRGEEPDLRVPMFKGLMSNPLAREFVADGPMILIGAGVGVAPFRGFVHRRLKNANCVNKVWVLQGVRDSLVDELYSGEWGVHESEVKRVVQSRRGTKRYVQDEVLEQKDLVWNVINHLDGGIFVCGSSAGMGEGVEKALVEVAMLKGNMSEEEANEFWKLKMEAGQYTAETW
jgi:sulfite reductase alpha subunit-like flavoprotein